MLAYVLGSLLQEGSRTATTPPRLMASLASGAFDCIQVKRGRRDVGRGEANTASRAVEGSNWGVGALTVHGLISTASEVLVRRGFFVGGIDLGLRRSYLHWYFHCPRHALEIRIKRQCCPLFFLAVYLEPSVRLYSNRRKSSEATCNMEKAFPVLSPPSPLSPSCALSL